MGDPVNGGTGYSWFLVELTSDYVEPPPEPEPPETIIGGGHPVVSFGGPISDGAEISARIPSEVKLPTEEDSLFSITGSVNIPMSEMRLELGADVVVSTETQVSLSSGRGPARHWNAVLQDEEELLLLL